ncbi:HU family DNA-binding protein [Mesoplasma tabanidae]|uniref:Uncharacterized protein n=1 Tax=Mesoplasma tabanidae TaxID=219745 RepID=A0A2K8P6G3_9MOLU|nr:HU family DNA-binding protein [Mesoplasma tabanidae]ATZ21710.1 hypothetical protein MTABA_v1c05140 [Mesoplasma tabanidae]
MKIRLKIILGLIFLIILSTILMVFFKMLNALYFNNENWREAIINNYGVAKINDKWFKDGPMLFSMLLGPIGLKSMFSFNWKSGEIFLKPVFWDFLINWIYLITVLILLIIIAFIVIKIMLEKKTKKLSHEHIAKIDKIKKENQLTNSFDNSEYVLSNQKIIKTREKLLKEVKLIRKTKYDKVSKMYLIKKIQEIYPDFKKKDVSIIVNSLFINLENNLVNDKEIIIENFGKLTKVNKPAKIAINPSNGESIKIPESNNIYFKASKNLKLLMSDTKWTGIEYSKKIIEKITIEQEEN